jgi:hypothetical protein
MNDNLPTPRKTSRKKDNWTHLGEAAGRVFIRAALKKGRREAAAERVRNRLRPIKEADDG